MASDLAKSKCFMLTQIMGSQPPGGLAPVLYIQEEASGTEASTQGGIFGI